MGMYDTLELEKNVQIEELPIDIEPYELNWQTKSVSPPSLRKYKITEDGKLLRKETTKRKMSDEELDEKAKDNGYDSWEDWVESDTILSKPLKTDEYITENVWWANHNMHGSVEFHTSTKRNSNIDDYYISYEASFTKGELDEIMLLEIKES